MRDGKRSYTAEGVAALRAAGAMEWDVAVRNPDHLAERLLSWRFRLRLHPPFMRRLALTVIQRALPGIYPFVTARTKYFDAALGAALAAGCQQVVVLGAGGDTRAYRFADDANGIPFFEVDHPSTSAWKRQTMARLPRLSADVRYVAMDFTTDSLVKSLAAAGAEQGRVTLFLWEGVTPYLTGPSVDETLNAIAEFAPGSSVVFDYFHKDAIDHPDQNADGGKYVAYLRDHGEPLRFGIDPENVESFLTERGFELVDHATPDDLGDLVRSSTRAWTMGKPLSSSSIVHARRPVA